MEHFDFDLYEELGLTPAATEQEIRAAYKKKALVHHPDRNGGVQSDEFLRLKQAYDNLIDAAKRQNYDAFHHTGEFKPTGGRSPLRRPRGSSTSRSVRGA